jgi:hypothetical protein
LHREDGPEETKRTQSANNRAPVVYVKTE